MTNDLGICAAIKEIGEKKPLYHPQVNTYDFSHVTEIRFLYWDEEPKICPLVST